MTLLALMAPLTGCAMLSFRGDEATETLETLTDEATSSLISQYAYPSGLKYEQVESVALVTGLDGTGEDPPQSPQRAAILDEMKRRQVDDPNRVLASPSTAIVVVRGFLKPGVQKGDRFDVEVRTPTRSEATSLRNGWLMPTELKQLAALGGQIRAGRTLANAEGDVLVDPSATDEDDVAMATRGRVLGGGVARKSRPLGLMVAEDHRSVRMTQSIAKAINERFSSYDGGRRSGVAEPKDDRFVELRLHPRYKDNVTRYVKVIRSLGLRETPGERLARVDVLAQQLLDPLTASRAALRLEAIGGEPAIEPLVVGAASDDPEVRFYAAEALAYLDRTECVAPLAAAARDEPAFRVHALAALSAMDDVVAYESLREMLASPSAETRYGAFRALYAMNPADPLLRGDRLGGQFGFHVLDVDGPPMIHVTRSRRPEIVLFGADQQLKLPVVLDAGRDLLLNGMDGDRIVVSRIRPGEETEKRTVSTDLAEVVRTLVELGGAYPDVVQALQQANAAGALPGRFRVDATPRAGRVYDRADGDSEEDLAGEDGVTGDGGGAPSDYRVATPVPDLFSEHN